MLTPVDQEVDVEVRREDQNAINEFGRLNNKKTEIKAELEVLEKELKTLVDSQEVAEMVIDDADGGIRILLGDVFIECEQDEAEAHLTDLREKVEKQVAEQEAVLEGIEGRLSELKTALYGRFGKTINLEDS